MILAEVKPGNFGFPTKGGKVPLKKISVLVLRSAHIKNVLMFFDVLCFKNKAQNCTEDNRI